MIIITIIVIQYRGMRGALVPLGSKSTKFYIIGTAFEETFLNGPVCPEKAV
jgi:hypothetical protein